MKIAIVSGTFPPYRGGIGNAAYHEAVALSRLGQEVAVFTPDYGRSDPPPPATLPFAVHRLRPLIAAGNAAICRGLVAGTRNADCILVHYPFYGGAEMVWLNQWLTPQRRRPRLIIRYDLDVVGRGLKGLVFGLHAALLLPRILACADRVVFSSFDYARHSALVGTFLRRHPERCAEIPYGVDRERFYPEPGLRKEPKSLLFVGGLDRAHYFKGLDNLFEAAAPLLLADRDVKLRVVGNGELLPAYRATCHRLGIETRVEFLAGCTDDQLRGLYTRSGATVLPSVDRSESFGLVLLESMACGTAIVASSLAGVRTLVAEGANGLLIPAAGGARGAPYTIEGLRQALRQVLENPDRTCAWGRDAIRHVAGKYDWTVIAGQLLALATEGRGP